MLLMSDLQVNSLQSLTRGTNTLDIYDLQVNSPKAQAGVNSPQSLIRGG
jgi:hypothetical protein